MRTFDLAPLYRSTVGFDRLFSLFDDLAGHDGGTPGYPPYNIERTGENDYRITRSRGRLRRARAQHRGEGEHADDPRREADQDRREEGRDALSGHRRARLRARVPARRPRPGQGRVAGERSPARRPRARDPRGQEAAPDHDRQRQRRKVVEQKALPKRYDRTIMSIGGSAPVFRGAFILRRRRLIPAARPAPSSRSPASAARRARTWQAPAAVRSRDRLHRGRRCGGRRRRLAPVLDWRRPGPRARQRRLRRAARRRAAWVPCGVGGERAGGSASRHERSAMARGGAGGAVGSGAWRRGGASRTSRRRS